MPSAHTASSIGSASDFRMERLCHISGRPLDWYRSMERRDVIRFGAALSGLAIARGLSAQDPSANWPAKTVRLIIPFTPGGSTDFQGRLLCEWLGRHFGQQFVIDHKPGAGSNIGVAELA